MIGATGDQPAVQHHDLKRRALGAAVWAVVRTGGDQILRFTLFIYLAKVLTPRDFGVFAVATLFVDYGRLLAVGGLTDAIIQSEEADEELRNTVFWSLMAQFALIAAALAGGSWALAGLAGVPAAQPFLLAMAALLLLTPLSAVHAAMARREFKNKRLTANGLGSSVAGAVAALIALHQGLGLWSLVIQQLVTGLLSTVLTWTIEPWAPRLQFSTQRLRSVWKFSGNVLLARILQTSVLRIQDLLAARFLGPAPLGHYRLAGRTFELLNNALIGPLSSAAFPVLSRLQNDSQAYQNAYGRMIALSCLGICPAALGFGAVAPDIVPLVLGERWLPSVPVIQVLSLLAPASVLAIFAGPALAARGRADVTVKFAMMQLTGTTILSVLAIPFGVVALAGAYVLRSYMTLPIQLRMFSEATGMPWRRIIFNVLPALVASGVMVLAILIAGRLLLGEPHVMRVVVMIALGISIYAAVLGIFFRRFVFGQIAWLRSTIFGG